MKDVITANSLTAKNDSSLIRFTSQNFQGTNLNQVINFFSHYLSKNAVLRSLPFVGFSSSSGIYNFDNKTEYFRGINTENFRIILKKSLITFYTDNSGDIAEFIEFSANWLKNLPRPKCLVIFIGQNPTLNVIADQVLKYSWDKKFLDFTIISIDIESTNTGPPTVYNYNPFFNKMKKAPFNDTTRIFPDKFKNTNNYLMKIPYKTTAKYQIMIRGKSGKLQSQGGDQLLVEFILRKMGFGYVYKNSTLFDFNEYDMYGCKLGSFYVTLSNREFVSNEKSQWGVVALISNTSSRKLNFSWGKICQIIVATFIILLFVMVTQYFGINTNFSKKFNIARIILGQSLPREPKKVFDQIIFMMLLFLFIWSSNEVYSNIVNVTYGNDEDSFLNSPKDLDESLLPVYICLPTYQDMMNYTKNKYLVSMSVKAQIINDDDPELACAKLLLKSKKIICIMADFSAESFVNTYRNPDGTARMRIAKSPLFKTSFFYLFNYSSPYKERFTKIARKVNEANLINMLTLIYKAPIKKREFIYDNNVKEDENNVEQLLLILSFGHLTATLTFFLEFIVVNFKKIFQYVSFCICFC